MNKKRDYTFIITIGRTGSKLLRRIINENSNIHISTEIHFRSLIYQDFIKKTNNKVKKLDSDSKIMDIAEDFYNLTHFGSFWKKMISYHDSNYLGYDNLVREIIRSDKTYKSIFKILIENDAKEHKKKRSGAKAPFHIYYANKLVKWFPNANYIHLIRDPRAIVASYIHQKEFLRVISKKLRINYKKSIIPKWVIIIFVIMNYHLLAFFYIVNNNKKNYLLVKYESLIKKKEKEIKEILKFLGNSNIQEIYFPNHIGKSYDFINKNSVNTNYINKWQEYLTKFEIVIIWFFTFLPAKKLGYSWKSI